MTYVSKTVKRSMYVRLDWSKPREEQLVVIGNDFEFDRPSLNLVYMGRFRQALEKSSVLGFITMSDEDLRRNYKIKYLGQERTGSNVKAWHLKFLPVNKTNKTLIELWGDFNGMPYQLNSN